MAVVGVVTAVCCGIVASWCRKKLAHHRRPAPPHKPKASVIISTTRYSTIGSWVNLEWYLICKGKMRNLFNPICTTLSSRTGPSPLHHLHSRSSGTGHSSRKSDLRAPTIAMKLSALIRVLRWASRKPRKALRQNAAGSSQVTPAESPLVTPAKSPLVTQAEFPLLESPPEILLLVLDRLELWDLFQLSHTCRALRTVSHRDWDDEPRPLSSGQRLDFWVGLAYSIATHWAYEYCCQLHRVDFPGELRLMLRGCNNQSCHKNEQHGSICTGHSTPRMWRRQHSYSHESMHRLQHGYPLEHMHLQLILKSSDRIGSPVHQKYLITLLKSWQAVASPAPQRLALSQEAFTAIPRVIDSRLVISLMWEFTSPSNSQIDGIVTGHKPGTQVRLCPHLVLLTRHRRQSRMFNIADSAADRKGKELRGH